MKVQGKYKKAVDEFVGKVLKKYNNRIERIMLFGSYARGDYIMGSDIDILILLNSEDYKVRKDILAISFDVLLKTKVYISPKVISLKDFQNLKSMKSSFFQNISREGIAVG